MFMMRKTLTFRWKTMAGRTLGMLAAASFFVATPPSSADARDATAPAGPTYVATVAPGRLLSDAGIFEILDEALSYGWSYSIGYQSPLPAISSFNPASGTGVFADGPYFGLRAFPGRPVTITVAATEVELGHTEWRPPVEAAAGDRPVLSGYAYVASASEPTYGWGYIGLWRSTDADAPHTLLVWFGRDPHGDLFHLALGRGRSADLAFGWTSLPLHGWEGFELLHQDHQRNLFSHYRYEVNVSEIRRRMLAR
ncbi:MAG: hypothetical protein ACK4K7_07555 [Allosphingosinicella sp.]|uniref:hypothetical protein n=1 Tax=Allosphingosinicella sp. TaxID=2823234 RepID=UPI003922DFD9